MVRVHSPFNRAEATLLDLQQKKQAKPSTDGRHARLLAGPGRVLQACFWVAARNVWPSLHVGGYARHASVLRKNAQSGQVRLGLGYKGSATWRIAV
jgi:hypothetical protein